MNKYNSLERLSNLLERGYITRDEFEREKAKILGDEYIQEKNNNNQENLTKNNLNKTSINKVNKTTLLKKCKFEPRSWYMNLLLGAVTLGIYRYFFIFKRLIFLYYLKRYTKNPRNFNKINKNLLLFIYILLNIFTLGYINLIFGPALSLGYMIFFKEWKSYLLSIVLLLFIIGLFAILNGENKFVIGLVGVLYFSFLIYLYRIDYLIKNYLTEDLKIVNTD